MKKVFAVLLIFLFLSSCSIQTFKKNKINTDNILYSCIGDFDGDSRFDTIYLKKEDNTIKIVLKSKRTTKTQDIKLNIDNFYCSVEDINDDKCDDFIINSIEDNVENIYIFTFKDAIKEILSPNIIRDQINLIRKGSIYTVSFGDYKKQINSNEELNLKLLYSETEYTEHGKAIITEGVLVNKNNEPRYTISITYKIKSLGSATQVKCDIFHLEPYKVPPK
ncbi:hypothetical protein [Caloramator proteoclasticus]|uniref:Lipoprotein n=1 Tax=Caloramator proteoclasticus DSM 10124 TaxID=1121262 RepID=A0A1M4WHW6_9CLOT|nr:hypothetical protein [Caloramator proteoclasticus]SHE80760.1 hypothetical protein SAMN02746091_01157 [Caloramator proteoclasticus DSM 10124]